MAEPQPIYRSLYVANYKWKSLDDNLFSWFCSAFMLSLMLAGFVAAPDDHSADRPFFVPLLIFTAISFGVVLFAKLIAVATFSRRKVTGAVLQMLERAEECLVPLLISHAHILKPEVREDSYDQLRNILFEALVERIPLDNTLNTDPTKIRSVAFCAYNSKVHVTYTTQRDVRFACNEIGLENKISYWLEESCQAIPPSSDFHNKLLSASRHIIDSSEHADSDLIAMAPEQETLQPD